MGFNKPRLQPPSVQYIVAMTCRKTVQIEKARIDKYNWIDVYFLEELLDAGVFAEDHKEEILAKQKSDAGHPQATAPDRGRPAHIGSRAHVGGNQVGQ